MLFVLSFLIITFVSSSLYSTTGTVSELDPFTNTIRNHRIEIPDGLIPKRNPDNPLYEQLPGWPQKMITKGVIAPRRGIALTPLSIYDSTTYLVASIGSRIHVYRSNGTICWGKNLLNTAQDAPAVADVNNDGYMEIAFTTRELTYGGILYLYNHNGGLFNGFPVYFNGDLGNGNKFACSPALSDVNNDSLMEIIIAERDHPKGWLHVLELDGTEINDSFPVELDNLPAVTAAIGDIDNSGEKEIVYCSGTSLYAFGLDGEVKTGFPVTLEDSIYYSYQSPILVDINNDRNLEIVTIASGRYGKPSLVNVYNYKGAVLKGWPYIFLNSGIPQTPPSVVDPSDNGNYIIYTGFIGGMDTIPALCGLSEDGKLLPNYPIKAFGGPGGFISVADIDNDNDFEVLFDCNLTVISDIDSVRRGFLYAYNQDGSGLVSGFPLRPKGCTYTGGANLGDLNNDGTLDLVAVSWDEDTAYINAWSLNVPYDPDKILFGTYHFNNARDGLLPKPENTSIKEYTTAQQDVPVVIVGGKKIPAASHSKVRIYSLQGRLIKEVPVSMYSHAKSELARGVFIVNIISQGKRVEKLRVAKW